MKMSILKPFDAAWFFVEQQSAPAHFGPTLTLTRPAGSPDSFVADLARRWRNCKTFVAPFNCRLHKAPLPWWERLPDERIDLRHHFRYHALPTPGGDDELASLISRLHSDPLDPRRPLWECHVIDGLSNDRFALYLKFHHGQLDGVGCARLLARILSPVEQTGDLLPPWAAESGDCSRTVPPAKPAPNSDGSEAAHPKAAGRQGLTALVDAVSVISRMCWGIRTGRAPDLVGPFQAPTLMFNGRIGSRRQFVALHYDVARLTRIAEATGVTVNDVYLALVGGGLRGYLQEQNALPEQSAVGQIPVNIRRDGQSPLGNALAFLYARLHTDIADPVERLRAVHRSTSASKQLHQSLSDAAVLPFTMLLSSPFITQAVLGLTGRLRPAANLVISNVPGPRERLYFNRSRVETIFGPSVLFHGQALNVTMSSYAGQADIGFTACPDSVPDIDTLASQTHATLTDLEVRLAIGETAR